MQSGRFARKADCRKGEKMKKTIGIIAFLLSVLLLFSSCLGGGDGSSASDKPSSENSESISDDGNSESDEPTSESEERSESEEDSEKPDDYSDILKDYEKSSAVTQFPSEDLAKVNVKPTFDISDCVYDAEGIIVPYQLFGDGMILQRDAVNKIWGTIENLEGNKHIAATFRGRTYYGEVKDDKWEIYFPKMTAGGPFEITLICDWGTKTIKDVYVGEVYLLSGQSNMEWKTGWSEDVLADLYSDENACRNDKIRLLSLGGKFRDQPTKTLTTPPIWEGANSSSIPNFSAVGYIFGKKLQETLDCPVGLVCTAIGGSIIESWMDEETYDEYKKNNETACDDSAIWKMPNQGFNGMIYPLEGFNFRGVCWYQGCSNVYGTEGHHDNALRSLISCWRKFFKNPELTFSISELARFHENTIAYSTINEKIGIVAREDKFVCNAINLDQGEWGDIHPRDKRTIGTRLSSETLRNFFGCNENAAPEVIAHRVIFDKEVRLVMSESVVLKNGANGFEVLTESGYSSKCSVSLNGNAITVTSTVPFTAIRYGYDFEKTAEIVEDFTKTITIYDEEGLPCDMFLINLK